MKSNEKNNLDVSIMAGNPLMDVGEDGVVRVETQLIAFEKALDEYKREIRRSRAQRDYAVNLCMLLDHPGGALSDTYYCPDWSNLSSRQRKKPTLALLRDEFREKHIEILEKHGVSASEVIIVPESKCRTKARQEFKDIDKIFRKCETDPACEATRKQVVNCVGIVAGMISIMDKKKPLTIWGFWESGPRCNPEVIIEGTRLALTKRPLGTYTGQTIIDRQGEEHDFEFITDDDGKCEAMYCKDEEYNKRMKEIQ